QGVRLDEVALLCRWGWSSGNVPASPTACAARGEEAMRRIRSWGPGLLLVAPSLIALGIFVYGFLGWNIRVSLSSWRGLQNPNDYVGPRNYRALASDERFGLDVRHIVIFTLVFMVGSLALGFVMALLLDKGVVGETFFRSVYLFPMAISFIA